MYQKSVLNPPVKCRFCDDYWFTSLQCLQNHEEQFHNINYSNPLIQYYHQSEPANPPSAQLDPQMASSSTSAPPPGAQVQEFTCEKCQKTLKTKSGFQKHVCPGTTSAKINCEFCKQKFATVPALQKHVQKKHGGAELNEEGASVSGGDTGDFRCSWCFQRFETQSAAEVHEKIHFAKDKQVFKCNTCFYKFSSQARLDDHDKALCAYNSLLSQCVAQSKDDGPHDNSDLPGEGQEGGSFTEDFAEHTTSGSRKRSEPSKTKSKSKAKASQNDSESEPEDPPRKYRKLSDKPTGKGKTPQRSTAKRKSNADADSAAGDDSSSKS